MTRDQLVALAIKPHFANVDRKHLDAAMDCFHDKTMLTVRTAFATHAGHAALQRMSMDYFGAFETIIHRNFTCTVAENNGRIAACFVTNPLTADGQKTLPENSSFRRVRGDRCQEVQDYMSAANPLV